MNKRFALISLLTVVVLVVCVITIMPSKKDSHNDDPNQVSSSDQFDKAIDSKVDDPASSGNSTTTVADKWKWRKEDLAERAKAEDKVENPRPFTEKSVHDALQEVRVDEDGNVILNNAAMVSLDEALERIYNQIDAEDMLELQELIRDGLPGKTGEQTAELVGNYHQFLQAKEQFDQMHSSIPVGPQTVQSIESDQVLYSQLQSLRELHLGKDVADNLFHDSDVNAEYMFESIKLSLQTGLSAEEVALRRSEIENRRREQLGEPPEGEVKL